MTDGERPPARWPLVAVAIVALVLGAVGGGWSMRVLLEPPDDALAAPPFTIVEAVEGTVERSLTVVASARWQEEASVIGQAEGTVTSVHRAGDGALEAGDRLYGVDLMPIVVAEGMVPFFRTLSTGATGPDVTQLQELLHHQGLLEDPPTGRFDADTVAAVRRWHDALGWRPSPDADRGSVPKGMLVAVPDLPARLLVDQELSVGLTVSAGHRVARTLAPTPEFTVSLGEGQRTLVAPGQAVRLQHEAGEWDAVIASVETTEEQVVVARLDGVDGAPVCAEPCDAVPTDGTAQYPATITIVPETSGIVVPGGALATDRDGRLCVVLEDGAIVHITLVAEANGRAVVEGLDTGARLRVPGDVP